MTNSRSPWAWDPTSLNNTDSDPGSPITEPMEAGLTNDRMRDTRADARKYLNDTVIGITTGGSGTLYTATTEQTITDLFDRFPICIIPHTVCGANPELAVNSIAEVPLKQVNGNAIAAGYLEEGIPYLFAYNEAEAQFRLVGPLAAAITAEIAAATAGTFGDLTDFINATDDTALTGDAIWDAAVSVSLTMDAAIDIDMANSTGAFNFKLSATLNTDTTISISNEKVGRVFTVRFTCDGTARIWTFPSGSVTPSGFDTDLKKTFAASQSHMATCYVPETGVYIWTFAENIRALT